MADIWHEMGGDLRLSASGDLLAVDGAEGTKQRVLRRLLTNPGGIIWHPRYGAGLARFVGQVAPAMRIAAVIRRQMKAERGVGASPPPETSVTADQSGMVVATVRYADKSTGLIQTLAARP